MERKAARMMRKPMVAASLSALSPVLAYILCLLPATSGLRYSTREQVVDPIEELNRTAEEIADGSYGGKVQVDGECACAALRGLPRSGRKVLGRMDWETRG